MMKFLFLVCVAYAYADSSKDGVWPGDSDTTCRCGWANKQTVSASRIVGGSFYERNEYPFIAGLIYSDITQGISPFCGGTIITPNHVVTAAHCTDDIIKNKTDISVLLGSHDRAVLSSDVVILGVTSINQHERFNAVIVSNDISILTLEASINFNDLIGPACMPLPGVDVTGQAVKVLGWGAEQFLGKMTMNPKELSATVMDPEECEDEWMGTVSGWHPTQICTHTKGESACQGDSGGPVMWLDPETNRYTLVGIVSYGPGCSDMKPNVNTRVEAFLPWIQKQIEATKPSDTCVKA